MQDAQRVPLEANLDVVGLFGNLDTRLYVLSPTAPFRTWECLERLIYAQVTGRDQLNSIFGEIFNPTRVPVSSASKVEEHRYLSRPRIQSR